MIKGDKNKGRITEFEFKNPHRCAGGSHIILDGKLTFTNEMGEVKVLEGGFYDNYMGLNDPNSIIRNRLYKISRGTCNADCTDSTQYFQISNVNIKK